MTTHGMIANKRTQRTRRTRRGTGRALMEGAGWTAALAIVVGCAGCSDDGGATVPVFPTTGSVVFEGRPAAGAFLTFHPRSPAGVDESTAPPTATTGADGRFSLTTQTRDDGAPAGEYAVTARWTRPIKQGGELVAGPDVIPRRYARAETTPLKATIRATTNALEPFQIVKK